MPLGVREGREGSKETYQPNVHNTERALRSAAVKSTEHEKVKGKKCRAAR